MSTPSSPAPPRSLLGVGVRAIAALVLLANIKSAPFAYHIRMIISIIRVEALRRWTLSSRLIKPAAAVAAGEGSPQSAADSLPGVPPKPSAGKYDPKAIWEPRVYRDRVLFDDMDWNFHMSNSSYNKHLDGARVGFLMRNFGAKRDVVYANAGVSVFFKREIPPFAVFHITTRLLTYDAKWFFFEHRFTYIKTKKDGSTEEVLCSVALDKQVIKRKDGKTVPFPEFLAMRGYGVTSPSAESADRETQRLKGWAVAEALLSVESGLMARVEADKAAQARNQDIVQMEVV
ncbi:hypothetical protein DFJ73DRAFT_774818 [Zopfochytrium polystomum]|nr:hypothetical protein DFJ73DRAFT_774818 [Zopfochytrium polystomum]